MLTIAQLKENFDSGKKMSYSEVYTYLASLNNTILADDPQRSLYDPTTESSTALFRRILMGGSDYRGPSPAKLSERKEYFGIVKDVALNNFIRKHVRITVPGKTFENYDNLAHKTIFCQGDSIFHSPRFLDLLKNVKLFEPVQPLSAYYWPEGAEPFYFYDPPKPVLDKTKNLWIKKSPIHVEYLDNDFVTQYPYHYLENSYNRFIARNKEIYGVDFVCLSATIHQNMLFKYKK
jgi:hypothetical protein